MSAVNPFLRKTRQKHFLARGPTQISMRKLPPKLNVKKTIQSRKSEHKLEYYLWKNRFVSLMDIFTVSQYGWISALDRKEWEEVREAFAQQWESKG